MLRKLIFVASLLASQSQAQSLSLEDLAAKVNERSNTLAGYEAYLRDPDPNRAMAAFQIMLESGDPTLTQLALGIGVYSTDPDIRQTALKAFFAGKPPIDLYFKADEMEENVQNEFNHWILDLGGSQGADYSATLSYQTGDWSDDLGCYVNLNRRDSCLLRVNATTVSVFLNGHHNYLRDQWVNLSLSEDGQLIGTLVGRYYKTNIGPMTISMRLAE